jgi:phosphopantothenoylcysteine decarboxylase/phosphopantothenate--cysteine ligase
VTAGPTREAIDPVRYISNRSSGKMGYAIADVFVLRKHKVRLIAGPVCLPPIKGAEIINVTTARQMAEAVKGNIAWCDVLVMAAAVADWRPVAVSGSKLKKGKAVPVIKMEATEDILKSVRKFKGNRIFVGFAAETEDAALEAKRKLKEKGLDLVVGNNVLEPGAGFEVDTNRVVLADIEGKTARWPLMTKKAIARKLVSRIEAMAGESDSWKTRG